MLSPLFPYFYCKLKKVKKSRGNRLKSGFFARRRHCSACFCKKAFPLSAMQGVRSARKKPAGNMRFDPPLTPYFLCAADRPLYRRNQHHNSDRQFDYVPDKLHILRSRKQTRSSISQPSQRCAAYFPFGPGGRMAEPNTSATSLMATNAWGSCSWIRRFKRAI